MYPGISPELSGSSLCYRAGGFFSFFNQPSKMKGAHNEYSCMQMLFVFEVVSLLCLPVHNSCLIFPSPCSRDFAFNLAWEDFVRVESFLHSLSNHEHCLSSFCRKQEDRVNVFSVLYNSSRCFLLGLCSSFLHFFPSVSQARDLKFSGLLPHPLTSHPRFPQATSSIWRDHSKLS